MLVDPAHPDVGVGLGLPGLQPGEADASQMRDATEASEQEAIERDLLLAAQGRSELEATQEAIEEAVMVASRAEWASHNPGRQARQARRLLGGGGVVGGGQL